MGDLLKNIIDIKGRFIPGILLLLNLYFLTPITNNEIGLFYKDLYVIADTFPILSQLFLFIFALVLGGSNQFISFRLLSRILEKPTPYLFFKKRDHFEEKDILLFYEKRMNNEETDNLKAKQIFDGLKVKVKTHSPDLALIAEKLESDINLYVGMILPLASSIFLLFYSGNYLIGLILFVIFITNIFDLRRSVRYREPHFIYNSYYNIVYKANV